MSNTEILIAARRDCVIKSYDAAKAENTVKFHERTDPRATQEYIFPNQINDAVRITNLFYTEKKLAVSIQKKTKVGADGLMIELAKQMTTHIDDEFVVNPENVRIITGMSNALWEKDMKDKAPSCFKNKIFHHGKLSNSELLNLVNALIIIDEVDTGDKEYQVLHNTLKNAKILDVNHMKTNNNKLILISATMIKELHDLYQWGNLHERFTMTIPQSYIGHQEFLDRGIIKEFYSLNTIEKATQWIQEDILDKYTTEYRVHIVRVNKKNYDAVRNACVDKNVIFRNHNSTDRLTDEEQKEFFINPLTNHIILAVNGFFRRANLIPNDWKLRIGATHELYTRKIDNNVQIQGLPGRMTGYWRDHLDAGHITGPYRTSIKAVKEYELNYSDPFGNNSYQSSGFKKEDGRIFASSTMLSPKHITNLVPVSLPIVRKLGSRPIIVIPGLSEEQTQKFKIENDVILDIIKNYNQQLYDEYKDYVKHYWNINTANKEEKYGLAKMMEPNAMSSETNIRKNEKHKNVLMIYLHKTTLYINPWVGSERPGPIPDTVPTNSSPPINSIAVPI